MQKNHWAISILLVVVSTTFAQLYGSASSGIAMFGMIGQNAAVDGYSRSPEPGIHFSLGTQYRWNQHEASTKLGYLQKGVRYIQTDRIGYVIELNYLILPLTYGYVNRTSSLHRGFVAGIEPAYLVSSKAEYIVEGKRQPATLKDLRHTDMAIILGGTLGRTLPHGDLSIELRGSVSVINNHPNNTEQDFNAGILLLLNYNHLLSPKSK